MHWSVWIVVGVAIGTTMGIALDNIGAGIASGAGIGVALAIAMREFAGGGGSDNSTGGD